MPNKPLHECGRTSVAGSRGNVMRVQTPRPGIDIHAFRGDPSRLGSPGRTVMLSTRRTHEGARVANEEEVEDV